MTKQARTANILLRAPLTNPEIRRLVHSTSVRCYSHGIREQDFNIVYTIYKSVQWRIYITLCVCGEGGGGRIIPQPCTNDFYLQKYSSVGKNSCDIGKFFTHKVLPRCRRSIVRQNRR